MENEKHEFHISIEKEIFDKLETIKDYHGIKNITEIESHPQNENALKIECIHKNREEKFISR